MENNNQYQNQFNQQSNNQLQEMNQNQNSQQSNNSKKRRNMYIAGPLILLIALVGVTYAFFNYTRTGLVNNIGTGRIYFNSTQGNTLYLTNMFPMASSEVSNANLDSISINIVGDTTYNNGQEFEISLVDVNNTIVSGSTEKAIPINYVATYEATSVATGEDPNTIGTSSNNYFSDRGSTTAVYKLNATGTVTEGEQVLIGYIPANVAVNGTLTIKAYLDGSSIAISDTYPSGDVTHIETSGEATSEVLDYTDGTTSEWVNGRTVLTTNEWNSLQNTPISFKIKAESNEGTWVPLPSVVINYNANGGTVSQASKTIPGDSTTYGALAAPTKTNYYFDGWWTAAEGGTRVTSTTAFTSGSATTLYAHWDQYLCKRVTNAANLHTETCNFACEQDFASGATITYGNAKELGEELTVGDAFDCNVDGTGYNERFYYISPYFDTQATLASGETPQTRTSTFDNTTATLIYYKNFVGGSASDGGAAYATQADIQEAYPSETISDYDNWHGPVTALKNLPSTDTWNNITLKTDTRVILEENKNEHNYTSAYLQLPTVFSYEDKAARLLTAQEVMNGCGLTKVGVETTGELSNCKFLFERTKYANNSYATSGPWLETPLAGSRYDAWYVYNVGRNVKHTVTWVSDFGVRPAIDVPVSALLK